MRLIKKIKIIINIYLLLIILIYLNNYFYKKEDCISIGLGGGYSGFWYFYGYFKRNYLLDKKIYCYSSGCLAIIANIQHNNYNSLLSSVKKIKNKYDKNLIDRFEVKNRIIKELANKVTNINNYDINILTSNFYGYCNIVRPKTNDELINALNMTSNIPYITTKLNLSLNIDGIFCLNKYPICSQRINEPFTPYFILNIFNPNLEFKDVKYFMNY